MKTLLAGLLAACLCSSIADAAQPHCAKGEGLFDLSAAIPPGTVAVWLMPSLAIGFTPPVVFYEVGHPEGRVQFGVNGPGSMIPRRLDIHGRGLFCASKGVQAFDVWRTE